MDIKELKQHIKNLAEVIREKKKQRKEVPNGYVSGLDSLRYEARHHHIAHCLLRGRTIDEIEQSTREDNPRNTQYYTKIMNSIEVKEVVSYAEAVCYS